MSNPAGYDLSIFNLPKVGGMAAVKRTEYQPAPTAKEPASKFSIRKSGASDTPPKAPMTGPPLDSGSRGYDLSIFDLAEAVTIPQRSKTGKEETATVHVKDFGAHVRSQIQSAFDYGSPREAVLSMYWQLGAAKGLKLMDDATMAQFEKLTEGFSTAKEPQAYFQKHIIPFLSGLTAIKRKKG